MKTSRTSTRTTLRRANALVTTVVLLLTSTARAHAEDVAPVSSEVPANAWAVVDGKPILRDEVQKKAKEQGQTESMALEYAIQDLVMLPRLARDGFPVDKVAEKDVDEALEKERAAAKSAGIDLDAMLARQGLTKEQVRSSLRLRVALKRRLERDLTDEKLRARFDRLKLEIGGEARARHIFVKGGATSGATRSMEDAKKRAQELLAKVKPDGSNFAALARAESDDPNAVLTGGDLDWFRLRPRPGLPESVVRAAFLQGKAGLIPEPVLAPGGWHVVLVLGVREVETINYDEKKDLLREQLLTENAIDLIQSWRNEAKVGYAKDAPRLQLPTPGR